MAAAGACCCRMKARRRARRSSGPPRPPRPAWRLVLPDGRPTSRTALKRAAKAAAAGEPAGPVAQEALDFLLEEVREARLVPVVDFKGRRGGAQAPGLLDEESEPEAEKIDGGQD